MVSKMQLAAISHARRVYVDLLKQCKVLRSDGAHRLPSDLVTELLLAEIVLCRVIDKYG